MMKLLILLGLFDIAYGKDRCAIPCTFTHHPVCGSDGHTYSNECVMTVKSCKQEQAIIVVHHGKCSKHTTFRCFFPIGLNLKPVCGSDGKLYSNKDVMRGAACEARKAITITHEPYFDHGYHGYQGYDCSKCEMLCLFNRKPVCGHDGKTYSNECDMRRTACKTKTPIVSVKDGLC